MARASGRAADGLIAADFRHAASGIHYEVNAQDGHVWMSYDRDVAGRVLNGRQELRYFVGSGKRGRTYLFEQQGYWFEAPINWYAKKQIWDMAPNHLADREMPLTMPVDPGCLRCHASGVASSLPDARNHYAGAPFAQGGITCAACHGDGSAHVASKGKAHMMNLDGLEPVKRDSICLNCHLEGQVAVARRGRKFEEFAPGDNLFDFEQVFVYRGEVGSGGRATSQWEALLHSACKKASGDRMTCTTCHDPHGSPSAEDRIAFYRKKCLNCHSQPEFATAHHAENPDCSACHMARAPTNDIAHEQVTDHFIKKHISPARVQPVTTGDLEAVGGIMPGARDLGLAYAQMADRGDQAAAMRAQQLLRQAEKEDQGAAADAEVHAQLGFLEQVSGHPDQAAAEYRLALAANPDDSLALGDLALIEAQQHHPAEAVRLWRTVVEHDPAQVGAAMNLAIVECETGDRASSLATLERLLVFSPDDTKARALSGEIRSGKRSCQAR